MAQGDTRLVYEVKRSYSNNEIETRTIQFNSGEEILLKSCTLTNNDNNRHLKVWLKDFNTGNRIAKLLSTNGGTSTYDREIAVNGDIGFEIKFNNTYDGSYSGELDAFFASGVQLK